MRNESRNHLVVGIFVAAAGLALVAWIALISGRSGATDRYEILYDRVTGLKRGAQVLYQGHHIGSIGSIDFLPDQRIFRVGVAIQRGWPIPQDSVAKIKASGLLSAVVIDIDAGVASQHLEPGATLQSESPGDLFAALASVAGEMGSLITKEVRPLLKLVRSDVPELFDSLQRVLAETNETVRRIGNVLKEENAQSLDRIVVNTERTTSDAASLLSEMRTTQGELNQAITTLNGVVQSRSGELEQSVDDLQKSLEAVALHVDAIATNLEAATRDMAAFSNQVRRDPSVVLRGRSKAEDPKETE